MLLLAVDWASSSLSCCSCSSLNCEISTSKSCVEDSTSSEPVGCLSSREVSVASFNEVDAIWVSFFAVAVVLSVAASREEEDLVDKLAVLERDVVVADAKVELVTFVSLFFDCCLACPIVSDVITDIISSPV